MKINDLLSDEELEDCLDGHSDIKMIRQIIEDTQIDNLIDEEDFADMFAYNIRGFIAVTFEEDQNAYNEAYTNNWEWGMTIAQNINALLVDKWTGM